MNTQIEVIPLKCSQNDAIHLNSKLKSALYKNYKFLSRDEHIPLVNGDTYGVLQYEITTFEAKCGYC